MSVVEKDATYKIQWQITGKDVKSDEITLEGNSQILCLGVKSHSFHQVLYLVAKSGYPFTTEIVEVFFNTCSASALDQRKQMTRVAGDEGQNHQVFSYEIMTEWKTPMMLTLWITLRQSIDEYSFQFGDTLLTDQLWSAAKSRKLTDIEIRVLKPGGLSTSSADRVTFYAHRSVLAARSPVFAGLIEKSLVSSAIDIDQVEPEVFKNLLYFIYTGRLSTHCGLADLQILADRYQVSTLQKMLRRPAVEMNASVLTSLIMSLQHSSSKSFYPSMTNNRLLKQETLSCSSGDNTNNGQSPLLLFGAPEIHSTGIIASPAVIQQVLSSFFCLLISCILNLLRISRGQQRIYSVSKIWARLTHQLLIIVWIVWVKPMEEL